MAGETAVRELTREPIEAEDPDLERMLRGVERIAEGLEGIGKLLIEGPAAALLTPPQTPARADVEMITSLTDRLASARKNGADYLTIPRAELGVALKLLEERGVKP